MRYLEGYDVCELGELAVVVDFDLFFQDWLDRNVHVNDLFEDTVRELTLSLSWLP